MGRFFCLSSSFGGMFFLFLHLGVWDYEYQIFTHISGGERVQLGEVYLTVDYEIILLT